MSPPVERGSGGLKPRPPVESVRVVDGPEELAEAAARAAVADLEAAVEAHGTATWVLTGGGTPGAAYRRLAGHGLRTGVEWDRVRAAMGDERCVPVTHPDSNWGLAAAALLDHVPVPDHHLLRPQGELGPEAAAGAYQAALAALPAGAAGGPRLEVVWLGMGEDGHCLSLFPGRPEVEVTDRLVVAVHDSPKPPPDRVSLTLAALAGTERLLVLAGWGSVTWLLDRAAAA